MGKNDFLTPKAIANRIKAKGLQKLRWYCQMCQKQCRDENGFKCHCMSESHQRQMQVFGYNPERFVEGYSEEFERTFMDLVRRSHRFSRVAATVVYNEYINDRHHVHMNSTEWTTLTEFIKYLGRTGKCKVEETPKGWFMTYIDREPETLMREKEQRKRERAEMADEERHEKALEEQIERAAKVAKVPPVVEEERKALQRNADDSEKIAFALPKGGAPVAGEAPGAVKARGAAEANGAPSIFEEANDRQQDGGAGSSSKTGEQDTGSRKEGHNGSHNAAATGRGNWQAANGHSSKEKGRGSTLEELMKEQERSKELSNRKDFWLAEGLVVKVMSKALKEKGYYKHKGVIQKVIGKYVAEVKMNDTGHVLRVDQEELETVLPQMGGLVRIVNGAYRGSNARLLSVDVDRFCAKVQVEKGQWDGRVLPTAQYEDICKVAV